MAKLRHIAVHTPDPEKTAEFYKRVFDMVEVGRTDSPIARGVYLSDGTINMAVLAFQDCGSGGPAGWIGTRVRVASFRILGRRHGRNPAPSG